MFIVLIFWGSFAAVSKLVLRNIDNFQVLFYIFGSAFLVMTLIFIFSGKIKVLKILTGKSVLILVLYSLPSFFYYFLYIMSLKLIPAVEASMLNYLFPVMIVIFAVPINKERINMAKLVSILLGFIGMVIIVTNGYIGSIKLSNIFGDILAIGAAVLWGIFSNLGKKNKIDSSLSIYIYTLVAFVLSTVSMFMFSSFTIPDATSCIGLLWIGISNIVLIYYLWFKVLKTASTLFVSSLSFVTPFVTLVFITFLLGEKISYIQIIGLLVIILGIAAQFFCKLILKISKDY
ncbi:MAG: hypothetical protein A2Y21_03695 [Clostridiales bacterium GWC2_40_7]|nr:MAG: hypothetical protein A2Y21_03695 [Clostridiales bacterium GWC2_40_7]